MSTCNSGSKKSLFWVKAFRETYKITEDVLDMPNFSERPWRLGEDLSENDNLLDGIMFDELITTVRCNCPVIDKKAVYNEFMRILEIREQDMYSLLDRNMDAIIAAAKKGR